MPSRRNLCLPGIEFLEISRFYGTEKQATPSIQMEHAPSGATEITYIFFVG